MTLLGQEFFDVVSKSLFVLQQKNFERLGGNKTVTVDVRVIAATNMNLSEMIKKKSFREDLYYRLSVFPITIPPLRERQSDIKPLADYYQNVVTGFKGPLPEDGEEKAREFGKEVGAKLSG